MRPASDRPADAARRSFLRGALLTREGRRSRDRAAPPLGPPPPALPAGLQQDNPCADCAAPCVQACAPGILRVHPEHHVRAGLAYLDFASGGCTFCMDCVHACPLPLEREQASRCLGLASLDAGRCMAWNGVVCMSCRFACPHSAIAVDARARPRVSVDRCTGCGACVGVCPQGALAVPPAPA